MTPLVSFRNVSYRIGENAILQDLSLDVPPGETLVLLGRSGSGKTTALKMVNGLVVVVCGFRSRLYAERCCAWALLAATVIVPTGVLVKLCLWYPHSAWLVLSIYTAGAIVALIIVGATEGVRRVSPVTKRILELTDGAAIAAVIPLLLWIASVYDVLRNLRF